MRGWSHILKWCQNNWSKGNPPNTGHLGPQIHTRDIWKSKCKSILCAATPFGDLVSTKAFHVLNREVLGRKWLGLAQLCFFWPIMLFPNSPVLPLLCFQPVLIMLKLCPIMLKLWQSKIGNHSKWHTAISTNYTIVYSKGQRSTKWILLKMSSSVNYAQYSVHYASIIPDAIFYLLCSNMLA